MSPMHPGERARRSDSTGAVIASWLAARDEAERALANGLERPEADGYAV